jgi:hypothetical protein
MTTLFLSSSSDEAKRRSGDPAARASATLFSRDVGTRDAFGSVLLSQAAGSPGLRRQDAAAPEDDEW